MSVKATDTRPRCSNFIPNAKNRIVRCKKLAPEFSHPEFPNSMHLCKQCHLIIETMRCLDPKLCEHKEFALMQVNQGWKDGIACCLRCYYAFNVNLEVKENGKGTISRA